MEPRLAPLMAYNFTFAAGILLLKFMPLESINSRMLAILAYLVLLSSSIILDRMFSNDSPSFARMRTQLHFEHPNITDSPNVHKITSQGQNWSHGKPRLAQSHF